MPDEPDQTVGDSVAPASAVAASTPIAAGHFVPGRELARGGMGRILVAEDRRLGRTVALKLLQRTSPALRARFEREAQITARLAHPAIVPVYEAGTLDNGEPFYAMKLVEGTPLDQAIAKAADLSARLGLLSSARAVCEALAYAHSKRIIHRDLKPANVLVGAFGETVVIDWGLAKDLLAADDSAGGAVDSQAEHAVTIDGEVVGTPSYMPPEQASGEGVDERADVYALGALLYHVVAGRPPYLGRTAGEVLAAVEAGPPPAVRALVPDVPDDLASIIGVAMERDPAARYPTAGALAEELRRFIDGRLVASHRYTGVELLRRWVRRHRTAVGVGAIALVVLAIGGVVSVRQIVAREHDTARALAESRLEQGRQLLVDGDPGQAAPLVAAALAELPGDPVARRLAAIALRETHRRLGAFEGTASAFRRDGRELAIGHADGTIAMIDPVTATPLRTLPALGGEIVQLAYAPDGARLAVASKTGGYLRDAGNGAGIAIATDGATSDVRFLPRGDRVVFASASAISLVGLDGVAVARDPRVRDAHALAVSDDGTTLVAIAQEGAIAWSTVDLARIREQPSGGAWRFAATLDRGDLITAGGDGVRRWGEHATTFVANPVSTLARLDDHRLLADATLVDTDTGSVRVLGRTAIQASTLLDRTHLITGGYDRTLRIWDLERAAQPIVVLETVRATATLLADPTGQRATSRGAGANARVELWDVSRAPVRTAVVGTRIDWIVADHHDRLAVHAQDGTGHATELMTASLEAVATLDGSPIGFRPNHDELVTDVGGRLVIYSAKTGARVRDVTDEPDLWHLAFSRTGAAIATSSDRRVSLRDAEWRVTASFDAPPDIFALAVDDLGRVVTGHGDGAVRIWDGRTGALLATAKGHTARVTEVDVRGETLVTGSWDLTTRAWAFPSGEARGIVKSFERPADAVVLAPSGELMVTADGSAAVNVWDAARGRLVERVPTLAGLAAVAFIDDDHVVAGGDGGRLEVIDLTAPPRSLEEVTRLVADSPRWRLEGGRVVEH